MRIFEKARNRRHATRPLADVQIDLTRLSYEKLLALMVVSGVSLVGLTIMLAQFYRDLWLMHLAVVMFFVCLARVGMVVTFLVHSRPTMTMRQSLTWDGRLALSVVSFSILNDTFGHGAGDTLLVLVANRLKSAVRKTDLVARLGGDEFAILQAPISNRLIVQGLAERINQSIAQPFEIDGHEVSIGASVGIWSSQNGQADPGEVVRKADEALYRVKHDGRGSFSFAEIVP